MSSNSTEQNLTDMDNQSNVNVMKEIEDNWSEYQEMLLNIGWKNISRRFVFVYMP